MKKYVKPILEMIMMEEDAIRTSNTLTVGDPNESPEPLEWLKL